MLVEYSDRGTSRVGALPREQQSVDLYREPTHPFSALGLGLEFGTEGLGLQIATPLTRTLQLRGGADFLNFGYGFAVDQAQYSGDVHLRSGHASIDWYPTGGLFRISPGVLIFKSGFAASVSVSGRNNFELGNTAYTSSPADPVHGSASLSMQRTVIPALTVGWGNLIGERRHHWTVPFEVGAAYTGHYTLNLNLAGTACYGQVGCMNTTSAPVQQSVRHEEGQLNETMKHFQVYPIVMTGFTFRF